MMLLTFSTHTCLQHSWETFHICWFCQSILKALLVTSCRNWPLDNACESKCSPGLALLNWRRWVQKGYQCNDVKLCARNVQNRVLEPHGMHWSINVEDMTTFPLFSLSHLHKNADCTLTWTFNVLEQSQLHYLYIVLKQIDHSPKTLFHFLMLLTINIIILYANGPI